MATTNTEAVGEFKILTNSYQAEYGRAVGGQVQMVTKSGTQAFHGSGYWFGRRSDWNANTWTNNRAAAPAPIGNGKAIEPPDVQARRLRLHDRRPDLHPGRLQHGEEEALLLLEPGVREAHQPAVAAHGARAHRPRAGRGLLPERRQQRQPLPLHPRLHDGAAVQLEQHRAAASRTAASSAGSPQSRLYAPGLAVSEPLPQRRTTRPAAASTTRARPRTATHRVEDLIRLDFQPTDKWRVTGRYMDTKNDTDPGVRHPLGRQRQLPGPDGGPLPEPRQELDGRAPPASSTPRPRSR